MLGVVGSAVLVGARAVPVRVEVHVSAGLPGFTVVGLPDAAVREARDRVRAALLSSGLRWPLRRVTVNLAPSATRKTGSGLDLPIAIGVLVANGDLTPTGVAGHGFTGELGLDGSLRHVDGVVALADAIEAPWIVVPEADAPSASFVRPGAIRGGRSLRAVLDALEGRVPWPEITDPDLGPAAGGTGEGTGASGGRWPDLADVRGQPVGRRAVEVAAAGGHHLLMVGPPGAGKTMLAERLPGLLPPLTRSQALEVCRTRSSAGLGLPPRAELRRVPFRAPHHGSSAVALIGGGSASLRPGEISLATNGVLFLDEMGEFPSSVLDALRQPLEEGVVRISRARGSVTMPARFLLVAAMNPCPCGSAGPQGHCRCSAAARARYTRRLSGPLLDRFDLIVPVARPVPEALVEGEPGEPSAAVAARVRAVRARAARRGVEGNAALDHAGLERFCPLDVDCRRLLADAVRAGRLSGRGAHRVRRVARTLADLADADVVARVHVAEAMALRSASGVLSGAGG